MVITTILLASVLLLFLWNIWERKRKMSWFQSIGIPSDPPSLLFGNLGKIQEKGMHACIDEWTKKYGKLFGFYEGPRPVLVVSDVDMIKQILVKEFSSLRGRKVFVLNSQDDKFANMFFTQGPRWKRLRVLAAPTFSALKMKEMSPLINLTVDQLMDVAADISAGGKPFDIHELFQRLTLDTIACCAFGLDINSLKDPNTMFLRKCRQLFSSFEVRRPLFKFLIPFAMVFPDFFGYIRPYVRPFIPFMIRWFHNAAAEIIKQRKADKSDRLDFIQLMLDAEEADQNPDDLSMTLDDPDGSTIKTPAQDIIKDGSAEAKTKNQSAQGKKTLTMEEMQAQCALFLLAGYETTSTALGFIAYELALNPDVQEKVYKEIIKHFPEEGPRPHYTSVSNLPYLDMVLSEVLRLHTFAQLGTNRQCSEPCVISGLPFRVGDCVQINIAAVHQDQEIWGPEDPALFVPERFLPERKENRHPMAWLPFGAGPKNCIGMRFAILEIKVTLVRLLKSYVIKSCDKTEVPLSKHKQGVMSPANGVWVTLEKRMV
jgi:cytochrome P450